MNWDPRFDVVGYVLEGEVSCVACLRVDPCSCGPDARDEHGVCEQGCSGPNGPHAIQRGEQRAFLFCQTCGKVLKREPRPGVAAARGAS